MTRNITIIITIVFFAFKSFGENSNKIVPSNDSLPIETDPYNKYKPMYFSILGIDSIAKADYIFADYTIDSIFMTRLYFEAVYIKCFKGGIYSPNYNYLSKSNPKEYKSIINIHTAHLLSINGKEYPFDGKGNIGCWSTIPESTKVSINSKLYSLYSNQHLLGRLIILESITPIE